MKTGLQTIECLSMSVDWCGVGGQRKKGNISLFKFVIALPSIRLAVENSVNSVL